MATNTDKNKTTDLDLETTVDNSAVVSNEKDVDNKKNTTKEKPLQDSDLIECVAQIPNLSYEDKKTGDFYRWDKVGDVEEIRFDVLKDMFRSANSYIKYFLFTFSDKRVIKHFRVENLYDNYQKLILEESYTRDGIKDIQEILPTLPKGLINTIITKVKALVVDEKITDVQVIRSLEKMFDIDLIYLLDK